MSKRLFETTSGPAKREAGLESEWLKGSILRAVYSLLLFPLSILFSFAFLSVHLNKLLFATQQHPFK